MNEALVNLLRPAWAPCSQFRGVCRDMIWDPKHGHIPRGFGGANGELDEVRLVIVTAEPGPPADGEAYTGSPADMLNSHITFFEALMHSNTLRRQGRQSSRYHTNLKSIVAYFWPNLSLAEQLRRTWFTEAVKCSARTSGGRIPRDIEAACTRLYLRREIDLFTRAYVLALGTKARDRLLRSGTRVDGWAQHPSARPNTLPEETWRSAGQQFQTWLQKQR